MSIKLKYLIVVVGIAVIIMGILLISTREEKPVLQFSLVPGGNAEILAQNFELVTQYFEQELDVQIEVFYTYDYIAIIRGMRAGKVDVAYLGAFSYVKAAELAGARVIINAGDADGNTKMYHSILITNKDSGLGSVATVKARSGELEVAFVDSLSTSGYLVPAAYMQSVSIDVKDHFREIIFAGNHAAVVQAVQLRQVDLGATWTSPYQRAVDEGLITTSDVFKIWQSGGIPLAPVAVSPDMPVDMKQRIQQAFLDMPHKAPAVMQQFEEYWSRSEYYVVANDADYDFIRQIAGELDDL